MFLLYFFNVVPLSRCFLLFTIVKWTNCVWRVRSHYFHHGQCAMHTGDGNAVSSAHQRLSGGLIKTLFTRDVYVSTYIDHGATERSLIEHTRSQSASRTSRNRGAANLERIFIMWCTQRSAGQAIAAFHNMHILLTCMCQWVCVTCWICGNIFRTGFSFERRQSTTMFVVIQLFVEPEGLDIMVCVFVGCFF